MLLRLRELVAEIPAGTVLTLLALFLEWVDEEVPDRTRPPDETAINGDEPHTWRERIWTVPEQTRIGVDQLGSV